LNHSRVTQKKNSYPFFPEGSRQLKLFWASLPIQGLEQANQAFSQAGFVRVTKREYPRVETACPDFPIQACSAPVRLTAKQSARFLSSKEHAG